MPRPRRHRDDLLPLDGQPSADERAVSDAAAAYSGDRVPLQVQEALGREETDAGIVREMGGHGPLDPTTSEACGRAALKRVGAGF